MQVPEERGHPGHAGPTREVSIGTEKAGRVVESVALVNQRAVGCFRDPKDPEMS